MMTFKELVLLISPFIIIGGLVWFHVVGGVDFLKWYRNRSRKMAIDKKLFYASHGLEYPVVAKPYNDMEVKEKFFTKADVVAMLLEVKDAVRHCEITGLWKANYQEGFNDGVAKSLDAIQQKINNLQINNSKVKEQDDAEL